MPEKAMSQKMSVWLIIGLVIIFSKSSNLYEPVPFT